MAGTAEPRESTAFQFVVSTTPRPSDAETRKRIRSHVMQGKNRRRPRQKMPSWIKGEDGRDVRPEQLAHAKKVALAGASPAPPKAGPGHSLTIFPDQMEEYMVKDVVIFMTVLKNALYPFDTIMDMTPYHSSWFKNLMIDPAYLHTVIFSAEAYFSHAKGGPRSPVAVKHITKALKILSERIASCGDDAISDATISTVISLTLAADFYGDVKASETHMRGLHKMIMMRGGLKELRGDAFDIRTKACRADLGHALSTGRPPLFFAEDMCWDLYVAAHSPIANAVSVSPEGEAARVADFVNRLDWRLANAWRDLHAFSQLGNLAHQTQRKLEPDTFHEMMASIMYRLLHLNFDIAGHATDEAVRLGMIAFSTTIFLQWEGVRVQYQQLRDSLSAALQALRGDDSGAPLSLVIWLLAVGSVSVLDEAEDTWLQEWFDELLRGAKIQSWADAKKALRDVMWIDMLHDRPAKTIVEESLARLAVASPSIKRSAGKDCLGPPKRLSPTPRAI